MTVPRTAENESLFASTYAELEDFVSIGVRPSEFRPAVIRRAVHRSAKPIASLHLNHPTALLEQKLTRIVTIGYRLLDPRRREDSIQRMMLGRIHPQLADEAARMAQSKGHQLISIESEDGTDGDSFAEGGLLKSQNRQGKNGDGEGYFTDDTSGPWNQSLRSTDLLIERPLKRALRTTRRWVSKRYVAAGAVIGFLFVSVSGWRVFRDDAPPLTTVMAITSPTPPVETQQVARQQEQTVTESATEIAILPEPMLPSMPEPTIELASKLVVPASYMDALLTAEADEGREVLPTTIETTDAEPAPPTHPAVVSPGQLANVFLGRVFVDGKDVGVLIELEPGARLSNDEIGQIAEQLNVDLTSATIEFVGIVTVEEATPVRIHLPQLNSDVVQSIAIDSESLTLFDGEPALAHQDVYRAELEAGQWTIRWHVSKVSEELSILIVDENSGAPLKIQTALSPMDSDPSALPTQWRFPVRAAQ